MDKGRGNRIFTALAALLLTAAVLLMIFAFSAQEGEQTYAVSQGLLRTFVGRIVSHLPSLSPYGIEDNIRKYAHIVEFFLLSTAFFLLSLAVFRRRKPAFHLLASLLLSAAAAGLDEWHQTFVPGRNGTLSDVFIDALGFVPGAVLCFILCLLVRGRRRRKEKTETCD